MDLVAMAERFPNPGETLIGDDFGVFPGGKGANQAVAAGCLGAHFCMIGKVGNDDFGERQIRNLQANGVETDGIGIEADAPSGVALIEVERSGENHIIVIPGANNGVDSKYIDGQIQRMKKYDIFLFQLEIPIETVCYAIKKLKALGKTVILDPAPARVLPDDIYPLVDIITPNESELLILNKTKELRDDTAEELYHKADCLLRKGVGQVILKVGKEGAHIIDGQNNIHIPGYKVNAIDTTAAGDTFNAALAVSLAHGLEITACVHFANAAAALSTTAKGAQSALPSKEQVQVLMNCK
jgi:ribokinase